MAASAFALAVPGKHTGEGTYYATGLTACGVTNNDSEYIAAVSHLLYDSFPGYSGGNPNHNPICGKSVTAHYKGKSVTVKITDRCVGCAKWDLDFSPAAFSKLAAFEIGRLEGVTWSFNN
ncbi:plant expansin [Irpex lacteus]|nr:plant expansin [Irpex lacteus]